MVCLKAKKITFGSLALRKKEDNYTSKWNLIVLKKSFKYLLKLIIFTMLDLFFKNKKNNILYFCTEKLLITHI